MTKNELKKYREKVKSLMDQASMIDDDVLAESLVVIACDINTKSAYDQAWKIYYVKKQKELDKLFNVDHRVREI